tara:strand:+ start:400 stop:543 length:144 start_codon:yes stop_codon:yes gene_type:complete
MTCERCLSEVDEHGCMADCSNAQGSFVYLLRRFNLGLIDYFHEEDEK